MTRQDIDTIISIICPNDEDFEKACISPAYLKNELEILALEQEPILDKIIAEIEAKIAEPQYQHEEEDWKVGLIMAETIIERYKAEIWHRL